MSLGSLPVTACWRAARATASRRRDGRQPDRRCAANEAAKTIIRAADLENKHRVAEAVKAVAFPYRLVIGVQHELAPGEGTDEYQQRRTRQVEIGEHHVHGAEAVPGPDEE